MPKANQQGFTLIELSIVLVIIGLIVGGVLVGQSLIAAAGVRGTISQIEKYNTAVNTFRDKYGALPGDLNASVATQFGFAARGAFAGEGDGNGVIEGIQNDAAASNSGCRSASGEASMVWVDLSTAKLIDGGFNINTSTGTGAISGAALNLYFPQATMGQGNYVYVWSGGPNGWAGGGGDSFNYYGISAINNTLVGAMWSNVGITVAQAYGIDSKIDDGSPRGGNVIAAYNTWSAPSGCNGSAAGGGTFGNVYTTATPGTALTCYDNGNVNGAAQKYSLSQSGGSNINCALSFRFQ